MSDTIALYEKQKAIDAAKAQEKAMKDAEEQRRQAEKDTRKNEFLQALQTVEALEYQQPNAQALVQDAIAKLPLADRLQNAISRISTLPTQDEWTASQAAKQAAEEQAQQEAQQQAQIQQNQLRSTLDREKFKWNNLEYYGPGGRPENDK